MLSWNSKQILNQHKQREYININNKHDLWCEILFWIKILTKHIKECNLKILSCFFKYQYLCLVQENNQEELKKIICKDKWFLKSINIQTIYFNTHPFPHSGTQKKNGMKENRTVRAEQTSKPKKTV